MSTQNTPIKVGVVGLGRAGWHIHVDRMRGDERFQIAAVSDLQEERLKEAADEFGCATFKSLDELLQGSDCEVVVIASQSADHAPHTIAALQAGKHVVVEKPMSLNTTEADQMIEAAKQSGKKLFVHQNYRYLPDVRHIQEIIQSGLLGRVFEIRIRALGFRRRNDWQTLQKHGGGNLNNTCPHYIDAALLMLESPVARLFTDLQLTTDVGDADDHTKIVFKGQNGRVIDLEVSTSCAFSEPKWTVLGTAGTLRSDGETSEIKYFDPAELQPLEVVDAVAAQGRKYGNEDVLPWKEETRPSVGEVPTDFYDNVYSVLRENGEMDITPEQVREVMRVIETAHRENPPL
jgi:predicted dehydrogenase